MEKDNAEDLIADEYNKLNNTVLRCNCCGEVITNISDAVWVHWYCFCKKCFDNR